VALTVERPRVEDAEAGVIEEARWRQRRRWARRISVALGAAGAAVAVVLVTGSGGGKPAASGGPAQPSPVFALSIRHGLAYENGVPITVGIAPDFTAGQVGLDVQLGGQGVSGGNYPTAAEPVFGPDADGFTVGEGRAGPGGEIDVTLVGPGVATMRVKGLGTFRPVRILGLLPGYKAFVFYRRPGALGTVLGPGINPDVLQGFEKAKHEPAITETLYNAAGKVIPIHYPHGVGFRDPSSYWQAPAKPAADARCALSSSLSNVSLQWGETASALRPDKEISGPAFLSCLNTWYRWDNNGFDVGILLNAEAPGTPPAALWNTTPLAGHPGIVAVKAVAWNYRLRTTGLFAQLTSQRIAALKKRLGVAAADRWIARFERAQKRAELRHGLIRSITLAPPAVARRVGNAWLIVRGGANTAQRLQFLNALKVTRLNLKQSN
jgi:hypothetical protein